MQNEMAAEFLQELSDTTAGRAFSSKDGKLKKTFASIVEELRYQYRLGFYPPEDNTAGALHQIKVKLHAEVTVTITVNIARSEDEAERQARGENVINSQFEEEAQLAAEAAADLLEGGAGQLATEGAFEE